MSQFIDNMTTKTKQKSDTYNLLIFTEPFSMDEHAANSINIGPLEFSMISSYQKNKKKTKNTNSPSLAN